MRVMDLAMKFFAEDLGLVVEPHHSQEAAADQRRIAFAIDGVESSRR
jgi:hypothetical protein